MPVLEHSKSCVQAVFPRATNQLYRSAHHQNALGQLVLEVDIQFRPQAMDHKLRFRRESFAAQSNDLVAPHLYRLLVA
jgi:cell division FtsZ-interacting protein ZapD